MGYVPIAVELLSDEQTLRLLNAASIGPIEMIDLCSICGLTGAACFRRISELKQLGLVREVVGKSGLFMSDMEKIELVFEDGYITAIIHWKDGGSDAWSMDPLSGIEVEIPIKDSIDHQYGLAVEYGVVDLNLPLRA